LNMLPETNNEPGAENDAAKEEDDTKEPPKEHHGCHRRHQCTQLPPGGRARQASTGVWGMAAGGAGSTACLAGCVDWQIMRRTLWRADFDDARDPNFKKARPGQRRHSGPRCLSPDISDWPRAFERMRAAHR
jgi:hypothetical protein